MISTTMIFVLYSGIGAKRSYKHTTDEFLAIMKKHFIDNEIYGIVNGDSHNPEKLKLFNFRDWLEWSGARLMQEN